MSMNPEDSERIKRIVKLSLAAGIGAAAIYNIRKGDKWGYLLLTDSKMFFMGVIQEGRQKINQVTGVLSDEVEIDEYIEPSATDIEEFESVFVDDVERNDSPSTAA